MNAQIPHATQPTVGARGWEEGQGRGLGWGKGAPETHGCLWLCVATNGRMSPQVTACDGLCEGLPVGVDRGDRLSDERVGLAAERHHADVEARLEAQPVELTKERLQDLR